MPAHILGAAHIILAFKFEPARIFSAAAAFAPVSAGSAPIEPRAQILRAMIALRAQVRRKFPRTVVSRSTAPIEFPAIEAAPDAYAAAHAVPRTLLEIGGQTAAHALPARPVSPRTLRTTRPARTLIVARPTAAARLFAV